MQQEDYNALIQSRYTDLVRNDPVYTGILESMADLLQEKQLEVSNVNDIMFDIDNSFGIWLDYIGKMVGQPRVLADYFPHPNFGFFGDPDAGSFGTEADPTVGEKWRSLYTHNEGTSYITDDYTYRSLIKARIIRNSCNGSINSILSIINLLSGDTSARIYPQAESGTALLSVNGATNPILQYFIRRLYTDGNLIPLPLGVKLFVQYTYDSHISCDGATDSSGCFEVVGRANLMIDGVWVLSNATEADIQNYLVSNGYTVSPNCNALQLNGSWSLNGQETLDGTIN